MSQEDENSMREKLKASLWFSIGKMVDEEASLLGTTATPQFIGAMTEMVWAQLETTAIDLESFSRHAGRTTVTTDDVLLMTRKNDALQGIMRDFVEGEKEKGKAGGAGGMGRAKKANGGASGGRRKK